MFKRSGSNALEPEEKGNSYFLLLGLVRAIVEKYGGHMEVDEKNNSFTLCVPGKNKDACFKELEEIIPLTEPLGRFPTIVR